MELGSFLGKLKGQEKEEPKQFLALVLTDELVQAAVWQVVKEQTEMVALGTPVEWDGDTGTTSELVTAVDATISSATEGMVQEPNEIILGIPHSWTDKNGVLGSKREFIKSINKELELKPLGYVAITDSVVSYLKMQEGTPTTSILIQVSRDELTLVLVRLGRIENIEMIGRGDDVVTDVIEGISRFKVSDNLPSRIILFNNMHNLDEIVQNLLSVDWQSQFPFLHIPKIETLPKDITIRALTVAGGSEVAKSLGFSVSEPQPSKEEESKEPEVVERVEASEPTPDPELVSPAEIGFGEEIKQGEKEEEVEVPEVEEVSAKITLPKLKLPTIKIPKISWNFPTGQRPLWIGLGMVVMVVAGILWAGWQLPSAKLEIQVIPKILDQDVEITLSTTATMTDIASGVVPAKLETKSASGEKIIETTGKKTVGEKAQGEVTIYNRTSLVKTFTKGTTISRDALKFTLDSDATIASKSAGSDYVDVPGKTSVPVTASAIGAEFNIAAGSELSVMNFGKDSYVAKNETGLTGGMAEEIQVVSKEDQKTLVQELTEELLSQMASEPQVGSEGEAVYLMASSAKISGETYSAKVGEQAKSLAANLTISASLLRYLTKDVTELVNSAIDQAVPAGFMRTAIPATVELFADTIDKTGETVKGRARVGVALLPTWDTSSLPNQLKGRSTSEIEGILKEAIPGFAGVTVTISPLWLPPRFKAMPRNSQKITISLIPATI